MKLLEASYRRNGSRMVAMLDKSTHEILSGNYDTAEQFIAKGLSECKQTPSLFHQALAQYLFLNLSAVYFYRGNYEEALDIAIQVYERDHSSPNALSLIICSQARMGNVQDAIEALSFLGKQASREHHLFCQAEIEAAKGNYGSALHFLNQLSRRRYFSTIHLGRKEMEKRLDEWSKAKSHVG